MKIITNGSRWAGESPGTIEELFDALNQYCLNPIYETSTQYFCEEGGKFGYRWGFDDYQISGNFIDVSHVFSIRGTLKELKPLIFAIEQHCLKPEYQKALLEMEPRK